MSEKGVNTEGHTRTLANTSVPLSIAVVGTGALGSALCRLLASARCADVLLIDPERLEAHNLAMSPLLREAYSIADRRALFSPASSGVLPHKAELLCRYARQQWGLPWRSLVDEFADVGLEQIAGVNVLCSVPDNALARAEVAFVARLLGKPVLDGGVLGENSDGARIAWFPPVPQAACYLCGMADDRLEQVVGYAASASLGCTPLEDAPPMTGTPVAVRETARAMWQQLQHFADGEASLTQSQAWRLQPLPEPRGKRNWYAEPVALRTSASCPWHEPPASELLPAPWQIPIEQTLLEYGRNSVQLLWPICTLARCDGCGARVEPLSATKDSDATADSANSAAELHWRVRSRVALVRRRLSCPQCGLVATLQPLLCIDRIAAGDPLAQRTPRQLGLPDRHLLLFCRHLGPATGRRECH